MAYVTISVAKRLYGCSTSSIVRWRNAGLLRSTQTPTGKSIYHIDDIIGIGKSIPTSMPTIVIKNPNDQVSTLKPKPQKGDGHFDSLFLWSLGSV